MIAPLETRLRSPDDVSSHERQQMYRLLSDHFDNVDRGDFERDLAEKERVVTISHPQRGILGFTTAMRLSAECQGRPLSALFSGDTVLDPGIWGAHGWMRCLARYAETAIAADDGPVLWLLLTATHRTYRVLPALFKEYYPRPDAATPAAIRQRMEQLVQLKFPGEFDSERGVVRLSRPTPVRAERKQLVLAGLEHRHGQFFAEINPGFLRGDYLVCVADVSARNRTRLGDRLFRIGD